MFEIKQDTAPTSFQNDFRKIFHRYPTELSQSNFLKVNILSNQTKFPVSSRGPRVSNRLLNLEQKAWYGMVMALKTQLKLHFFV